MVNLQSTILKIIGLIHRFFKIVFSTDAEQLFHRTLPGGCFSLIILFVAASVIIYSFSKFWPSSETNTSLDVKYCSILRSLEAFLGMELLFLLGFCFSLRPIFCGVSFVKVLGPGLSTVYIRCHIIKLFFIIIIWTLVWVTDYVLLVFFCCRRNLNSYPRL